MKVIYNFLWYYLNQLIKNYRPLTTLALKPKAKIAWFKKHIYYFLVTNHKTGQAHWLWYDVPRLQTDIPNSAHFFFLTRGCRFKPNSFDWIMNVRYYVD